MTRWMQRLVVVVALVLSGAMAALGQSGPLTGLARLDALASGVTEAADGSVRLDLSLSQPVAWRVFTLDDPRRLVLDLAQVDWRGADLSLPGLGAAITGMRAGNPGPGWSRLMFDLGLPLAVDRAEMVTQAADGARLTIALRPVSAAEFAARAGTPPSVAAEALPPVLVPAPAPANVPASVSGALRPLVVVLDPGHGGDDAGAERDGVREADLMLTFARELREELARAGAQVVLTREADVFVPLDGRVARAQAAAGDLFVSLHADALAQGRATGATVYTLSESGALAAGRALQERRAADRLIGGVDLSGTDGRVADALIDLARLDTAPRSAALADAIVAGLKGSVVGLHRNPRNEAGFTVLSAPEMPSVLVELGFLSNPRDRARLIDPAWRADAAVALRGAILAWADADAVLAPLRRR